MLVAYTTVLLTKYVLEGEVTKLSLRMKKLEEKFEKIGLDSGKKE